VPQTPHDQTSIGCGRDALRNTRVPGSVISVMFAAVQALAANQSSTTYCIVSGWLGRLIIPPTDANCLVFRTVLCKTDKDANSDALAEPPS
jgi:hypothetical protein